MGQWLTPTICARAARRVYLGSLELHARRYERARQYYQRCASEGADPERSSANQALEERWQEEQAGADTAA